MSQAAQSLPDLRIAAFPPGPTVWRVDWFGSVSFPDRSTRSTQPSVRVHLSEFAEQLSLGRDHHLPARGAGAARRISTHVSVGTTMLLRIGDLWQNQCLVAKPAYELEEFRDLQLDRDSVHVIKAGSSFDDGTFLLPFAEHPGHMGATASYCVKVAVEDGRLLVFPAMELIRFYFGSSSSLLAKLFAVDLRKDNLFTRSHLESGPRIATLQLAPGIPRASAHDVARIAFDDDAWRAVALVARSCLRASVRGAEIFPQGVFPFQGRTTLQVKGKWLSRDGNPRQTFLVYEIRSCSFPFPYGVLSYRVSDADLGDKRRQTSGDEGKTPQRAAARSSTPKAPRLNETDASRALAPQTSYLPQIHRFPDLLRKLTFTQESVEQELPLSTSSGNSPAVESWALDEPASNERVRSVTLVEPPRWMPGRPAPPHLALMLAALDSFPGEVQLLTGSDEDGWTIPMTMRCDPDGVIGDALLELGSVRRACVLRISTAEIGGLLAVLGTVKCTYLLLPLAAVADPVDLTVSMQRIVDAEQAHLEAQGRSEPANGPPDDSTSGAANLAAWMAAWLRRVPHDVSVLAGQPQPTDARA